jgi:hypothetical protein
MGRGREERGEGEREKEGKRKEEGGVLILQKFFLFDDISLEIRQPSCNDLVCDFVHLWYNRKNPKRRAGPKQRRERRGKKDARSFKRALFLSFSPFSLTNSPIG